MKGRMTAKRVVFWVVACALAIGLSGPHSHLGIAKDNQDFFTLYEALDEVLERIRSSYVDEGKIDELKIREAAIRGILSSLDDRFSAYLDVQQRKDLNVETTGAFGGLGIEISVEQGRLIVVSPIDDSPASRAGVAAGDYIAAINTDSTEGYTVDDAVKKLRGQPDTSVTLSIMRVGIDEPFDLTLKRAVIKLQTVKSYTLSHGIGYVRLRGFSEPTAKDVEKEIRDLVQKGAKGLIVDLRNNPGGLLESAIDVSSQFLEKGKLVVSTKGRLRHMISERYAKEGGAAVDLPIIVLVNKGSASASEIVTGALKDHGRAVIVGTKTFGKGSVQSIYELRSGSGLKLTTAYYYTPSGALIHEKGIPPDVEVEEKTVGKAFIELIRKDMFLEFSDQYVKQHQDLKLPFQVDDRVWDGFVRAVKQKGLPFAEADLLKEQDTIRTRIKYEIIRQAKGRDAAEQANLEQEDEPVKRAIQLLKVTAVLRKANGDLPVKAQANPQVPPTP